MKKWISGLILVCLFSSFLADGAGPRVETDHSKATAFALDCADSEDAHCENSENQPCPDDDCQDCHCCHNHCRFLSPIVAFHFKKEIHKASFQERTSFYKQPLLKANQRPPKHASINS